MIRPAHALVLLSALALAACQSGREDEEEAAAFVMAREAATAQAASAVATPGRASADAVGFRVLEGTAPFAKLDASGNGIWNVEFLIDPPSTAACVRSIAPIAASSCSATQMS